MFLHALLFCLLCTSVFATPVQTQVGDGRPSSYHAGAQEATHKPHTGFWYPIQARDGVHVDPDMFIEILPSGKIRLGELRAIDGAILKIYDHPFTMEDYEAITYDIEYWRRLPTRSTGFEDLLDCLSIGLTNEGRNVLFDVAECKSSSKKPRNNWATAGGDFNYWYKVPGPDSNNPDLVSVPVLQFDPDGQVVGMHQLGANGGVDPNYFVPHHKLNLLVIKGRYRRVPNPRIPLKLRLDEMKITVESNLGHILYNVVVLHGYDFRPNPVLVS